MAALLTLSLSADRLTSRAPRHKSRPHIQSSTTESYDWETQLDRVAAYN